MRRSFDAVVIGGGADGLTAAIHLAADGSKVLVLEAHAELGGTLREVEFAPGFRAAPLAPDLGWLAPEVLRAAGLGATSEINADPTVVALVEGEPLLLRRSVEATAEGLKRFSSSDAQCWPRFAGRVSRLTGFLAELYRAAPPRIDKNTLGDFLALASLGRKFHGLGKGEMVELLRTLPMAMADWLDDWFKSEPLKGALAALAVMDVPQGPISGGTAFTFLHRHVGAPQGVIGERMRLRQGPRALIAALEQRARAAGVTIETGAEVSNIIVRDNRISGVCLASGEEINGRIVVSSLDPYRSLLELLDPVYLDPDFIHAVRNIRFRGVTTKVLLALDGLPEMSSAAGGGAPHALAGSLLIAPSVRYVERAYDAVKYGRCADEPFIELRFPSIVQPEFAPADKHVAVMHVQYTPHRLREEKGWPAAGEHVADRALALVDHYVPGFGARVLARRVLTPVELEAQFGLREGAISQGEMMLDQLLFMRPLPGWSRYAMPLRGLYLCGPGTHPGYGMTGLSGHLAAQAVLAGGRR